MTIFNRQENREKILTQKYKQFCWITFGIVNIALTIFIVSVTIAFIFY